MLQPDLGSAVILNCIRVHNFICCRISIPILRVNRDCGCRAFIALIAAAPYRLDRIKSYIDPWNDPLGTGFQGIQSLFAIAPGGLFGHGYGNSRRSIYIYPNRKMISFFRLLQKKRVLLEQQSFCLLFVFLLLATFGIAIRTEARFRFLIVLGMASMILFQTFLNVGVVSGLLPVTGVTLPFISYGGSSLHDDLDGGGNRNALYEQKDIVDGGGVK